MELEGSDTGRAGCLMAVPSCVFTAAYAAKRLRADIEVIDEIAEEMRPVDGCLSVIDSDDENAACVTAFTDRGLDYLEERLDERRMQFMSDN